MRGPAGQPGRRPGPALRAPGGCGRGPAARRAPARSPRHRPVDACRASPGCSARPAPSRSPRRATTPSRGGSRSQEPGPVSPPGGVPSRPPAAEAAAPRRPSAPPRATTPRVTARAPRPGTTSRPSPRWRPGPRRRRPPSGPAGRGGPGRDAAERGPQAHRADAAAGQGACASAGYPTTTWSCPTSTCRGTTPSCASRPPASYEIVDLGSHNGTFVNGQRVTKQVLTEQDLVSIGSSTFRLTGGELRQFVDDGNITFTAQELVVKAGSKVLLDHVSVPDPGKVPARRHRPQRRGQVHPARRADRDAPRDHRHGAVRQPRPVPELQRAQVPDRPGPAGERAAHPADRAPCAAVLGRAPVPGGHQAGRAGRPGRRGDGRARPDQARQHPGRPAVRRPAQAGQRGAGAADQAVAAVPGRADLGPGPRPGQVGHGADAGPGPRRPDGHRRHPQRGQPGHLRPAARPGARRADRLLRPARGRARLLRPGPLGRGVPGLRAVPGPRLGRRVRRLARLRPVRAGPAAAAAPGAGQPGTGGHPAAAAARRVPAAGHADPALRAGDRVRPRLPDVHGSCCPSSSAR